MLLKRVNASPKRIGTTTQELNALLESVPKVLAAKERFQSLKREYARYLSSSKCYERHFRHWPQRIPNWSKEAEHIFALLEEVMLVHQILG